MSMMMNQKTMVESVTVRVPQSSSSSSSSLPKIKPKVRCNHRSDFCCVHLMIQNRNNFKRSTVPNRFMFYRGGSWVDFQSEVRESLRSGFMEGKPVIEAMIAGSKYVFDFLRMVQIDFGSGNQRSIAWIDENGKPFFPKVFVDEDFMNGLENSGIPNIEIEIRINGMSCKRKCEHLDLGVDGANNEVSSSIKNNKQKDENQVVGSKRQRLTSMDMETSKWPNAKLLTEADKAYSFVSFLFLSEITKTYPGAIISAIHQFDFSGPLEKARLEKFEMHNENKKAVRGVSNTVYAWYAASAETIAGILAHGFELPRKTSRFPAYGVGIHLSPLGLPQFSAMQSEVDNNGEKHIILCRVILGNIEKVDAGSQQCRPSSVEFDSGADDPINPRWYVVWSTNMNSHILPECVISFKSSTTHLPGQLGSCNGSKNTLTYLLKKIKSRLPSSKLKEVLTLYSSLVTGKLAKDNFIKQLRDIAGDELLMTIIREIRSSG